MSTASHDAGAHDHGSAHNSKHFWTGSILAIILTIIPFWLVMGNVLHDRETTGILIFVLALVQIVVHVVYFLHLNSRSENGWTLLSFLFTLIVVVVLVGGTIWVMNTLNNNMMPMPPANNPVEDHGMPGMN